MQIYETILWKLTEFFLQAWKQDRRGKGPIDSVKRVSGFWLRRRHESVRHDGQDDGGGDQLDPDHGGPGHHDELGSAEVVKDSLQRRNQGKSERDERRALLSNWYGVADMLKKDSRSVVRTYRPEC